MPADRPTTRAEAIEQALACEEAYSHARESNVWMSILAAAGWDWKSNPRKFLHSQRRAALALPADATPATDAGADCRTVDASGAPFGPMLSKMLNEAVEAVVDHPDFDERCRLSSLIAQAAAFIDAVNEGKGPRALPLPAAPAERAQKGAAQ